MPRAPYSLNSYTGGAPLAALSTSITATGTGLFLTNVSSGWNPLGVGGGFTVALDYGTGIEEKVYVPSGTYSWVAGSGVITISGITRGTDNTQPVAHVSGAPAAFVLTGIDLSEANRVVNQTLGQATTATSGYAYFSTGSGLVPQAIQPGKISGLNPGAIPYGSATGAWTDTSSTGGGAGQAGQLLMSYGNIANGGPEWVSFAVRETVQAVSTSNIPGTYTPNGNSTNDIPFLVDVFTTTASGQLIVDNYTVILGDRILLAGQTASLQNGVYICTNQGSSGSPAIFCRDNDTDSTAKLSASLVQVRAGTVYYGTTWQCQMSPTATIGVSPCPWVQLLTPAALASGQTFGYATINNATVNSGTFNGVTSVGTTFIRPTFTSAQETVTLVNTALNGLTTFNLGSGTVNYYTVAATNNFTFNLTGPVGISGALTTGQSITFTALALQGNPAYMTVSGAAIQIDGSTTGFTTYWQGGTIPASGNALQIDAYTFTIIKIGNPATYTVLASQTKF